MSQLLHFSLPQIAFIVASIFWSDGSYQESTYSRSRQSSLKRTRHWQILRVTMGEELAGVLRRKASDPTDLSTMTLMHVGVAACRRSLRRNQCGQRGLRTLRRLRRWMYSRSAVSTKASTVVCSSHHELFYCDTSNLLLCNFCYKLLGKVRIRLSLCRTW